MRRCDTQRAWSHHRVSIRLTVALLVVAAVCAAFIAGSPGAMRRLRRLSPSLAIQRLATRCASRASASSLARATLYYDATAIATVLVLQKMPIFWSYVGGFWLSYTVPISTATGQHTLKAVAQPSGVTAQTTITVTANWAQYDLGSKVQGSPIVVNGMVYVAPYGNTLYAFHLGNAAGPRAGSVAGCSTTPLPGGGTGVAHLPAAARSHGRRW